ncbi:MAG: hypothetical protein COT33_02065 [Candidatus Nealsonbacteria bacterium CG08_land_8_20_14_0_20_38_20]|uniref:DDH domain-containing protein n=1 Tax=Candidatus Nealsonbacteria bacterium CG08_land_8_20_14_0_20_38_20 TaxID=1974705 RepID=A0A2H0YLY0_9BACT|nr:MAG: hypothetical protein COT33_02065 [Candidatus Nealsonbacteria bacterium CG08_land_8_20_14_0_20_38_20]
MEIKNLRKAAERILEAIGKKEKIILYGDADLDGVTSVIILKETVRNLGGEIAAVYFSDREKEGYGISESGLNYLKKFSPSLLIAMDLGITNFEEVKLARKLGFEVIIIDHHEVIDKLPQAKIIVDPRQEGEEYPCKDLAAVGLVFKLAEFLLKEKLTAHLRQNFLELAALATIADMMPPVEENKAIIEEGKASLENSWRPGIWTFFETEPIKTLPDLSQKISKIISILNVREVKNRLPASYRLLTCSSLKDAKGLIEDLFEKNEGRKEMVKEMTEEIEKIISSQEPIIFSGGPEFEFTLIPSVASALCRKYKVPTFIFKKLEKDSLGTVRSPSGINSVSLMKKCSEHLLSFGGHPPASGFCLKNENLEKFKTCLIKEIKDIR